MPKIIALFAAACLAVGAITEGGPEFGGKQVQCDLAQSLRAKNVGGRDGAGLCVFTSIMHAARYQNEKRLWDFQKQMTAEPGGGYPDKVDKMIAKYGPGTKYVQITDGDLEFLKQALKSGRMPCITYCGRDVHYRQSIAHMVNLVYLDDEMACILDNNFVGSNQLVWMSVSEFKERFYGNGGKWAVILLNPPPPPAPHN